LAVDKLFSNSDLDESAIKLEAQIKSDAGTVTKQPATLRRDADAAFQRNDFRTGMLVLGQVVAAAPDDAASWLRLSRTVLQIRPRDDGERALLLDRASTSAYIAYQRASDRNLEADSLTVLGRSLADRKEWRGALDALRTAGIPAQGIYFGKAIALTVQLLVLEALLFLAAFGLYAVAADGGIGAPVSVSPSAPSGAPVVEREIVSVLASMALACAAAA